MKSILLAAALLAAAACSSAPAATPSPTPTPSPSGPLLTLTMRGGLCAPGACETSYYVEHDGRVHLAAKPPNELGYLVEQELADLRAAIGAADFDDIRSHAFAGTCPTAYDGQEMVLEFATPRFAPLRAAYLLYFRRVLPAIGRLVSKHTDAYSYLPESVLAFPDPDALATRLTTAGFRDILEIGRERRYDMHDIFITYPKPLVPRRWRIEVRERILSDGEIHVPLAAESLDKAIEKLGAENIASVAISFLHSYTNPTHEQLAGLGLV